MKVTGMNIGFTGTRKGCTEAQLEKVQWLVRGFGIVEAHHGDCVGADEQFHGIAKGSAERIVVHPPDVDTLRAFCDGDDVLEPRPYLERNRAIVDACDALIAAPGEMEEKQRSGTWATVRYARKAKRLIVIVYPDGTMAWEAPGFPGMLGGWGIPLDKMEK